MEQGLLVIEHRAKIAHACACCDKALMPRFFAVRSVGRP
jgi:hypothetical protein